MHDSSVFESRLLASRFGSDLLIHKGKRIKNNMESEMELHTTRNQIKTLNYKMIKFQIKYGLQAEARMNKNLKLKCPILVPELSN